MWKAVIVAEKIGTAEQLAVGLNLMFEKQVGFEAVSLSGDVVGKIKAAVPDMLITIDLAGFDRVTLTDNIAYNLLDCKQMHVICSKNLQNEKFLEKSLSIAMFFACSDRERCKMLKEHYPHIPWIECMDEWNSMDEVYSEKNITEIAKMLEMVMKECRLG